MTICCDLPPDVLKTGGLVTGQQIAPMAESGYTAGYSTPCDTVDAVLVDNGGKLGVSFLTWKAGENTPQTPNGNLFLTDIGISLAIAQSMTKYSYTHMSQGSRGCETPDSGFGFENWSTTVADVLLGDLVTIDHGAYVTSWQMVNTEIVATKDITINASDGGSTTTGSVHMVLFHTPMP